MTSFILLLRRTKVIGDKWPSLICEIILGEFSLRSPEIFWHLFSSFKIHLLIFGSYSNAEFIPYDVFKYDEINSMNFENLGVNLVKMFSKQLHVYLIWLNLVNFAYESMLCRREPINFLVSRLIYYISMDVKHSN